jgi:hypothetical protein
MVTFDATGELLLWCARMFVACSGSETCSASAHTDVHTIARNTEGVFHPSRDATRRPVGANRRA